MGSNRTESLLCILAAAMACLFLAASASGQDAAKYWQWEAKKPFHHAVVRVRSGSAGGAGVIVAADEKNCWIVTAAHTLLVGQGVPEMSWDGQRWYTGRLLGQDDENDVAIVWQPTLYRAYSAPLATASPKPGEMLSFAGFGGPADEMRRWTAKTANGTTEDVLIGETSTLNGDSGGGVFNSQGQLVGVISGGRNVQSFGLVSNGTDWKLHYPTYCCSVRPMRGLFGRFQQRQQGQRIRMAPQGRCAPGGCDPQGGGQVILQQGGLPEYVNPTEAAPVVTPTEPPLTPPATTPPVTTPPVTTSCPGLDDFKAQVAKEIAALNVKIAAAKGEKGDKGETGAKGDTGEAAQVNAAALATAVAGKLKSDPAFVAACQGEPGAAATIDLAALTTKLAEHLKADQAFVDACKGEVGESPPVDTSGISAKVVETLKADPEFLKSVKGEAGSSGSDADVDVDALARLVAKKLPDIQVLFVGKDDVQHSVQYVKLGGVLKIPPMILSKRENGRTFVQVKALGDKINLELVPVD